MKIEEILVIGVNSDFKDTLLSVLPLDGQSILDVDIFQMEVSPDLKIFLYDLDLERHIPLELVDHIKPHLSGILVIGDTFLSTDSIPQRDLLHNLMQECSDIPVIVAVGLDGGDEDYISEQFRERGFYLSKNSRLLFWRPEDITSIRNIWRSVLVDLQEPESVE